MEEQILHIGLDDTDSPKGMCTTFLAYKIINSLKNEKVKFVDLPKLIRFNPNVPWKTRGNGAVGLTIKTSRISKVKSKIKKLVSQYADVKNGANPGLAFYDHESLPEELIEFSKLALWKLIQRSNARTIAIRNNIDFFYEGNGQGLVGAIGAIGYIFTDYTLELLSYRKEKMFGKPRTISAKSVQIMQDKTAPYTFNSYDVKKGRVLITPHGPDPVLYGIRGERLESLLLAKDIIESEEEPDGYVIFKSNQGTGDHLRNFLNPSNIQAYQSGLLQGIVCQKPHVLNGGHVMFSIFSNNAKIMCGVYKPTGLTNIALNLIEGDEIKVGGGIRRASKNFPRVLNVEFIEIIKLSNHFSITNPFCHKCKKHMKSKGHNQGYQCVKCGRTSTKKLVSLIPRKLKTTLYIPVVTAHRHLTRPIHRIGKTNTKFQFDESTAWFKS